MKLDRAARWAEILANIGVIITLVVLIFQVRDNSRVLRSQSILSRSAAFTEPFFSESLAPSVLAKIKAVDGAEPIVAAYMDRYNLTYEEGAVWSRHLLSLWSSLETEYALFGPSPGLSDRIRILLPFPDEQLWIEHGGLVWLSTPEFQRYVEGLRAEF